jgi:amino acid transporter
MQRRLGVGGAAIANMLAMVGVGPFITMPLLLQAMGGPQAMLGWLLGALVALADGLVWAELGAQFPRSGGGYQYVLEAYGPQGAGRLMSFLYLWSNVVTGPFLVASGAIGFSQYASYLLPWMTPLEGKVLAMAACLAAMALVYRRIDSVGRWGWGFAVLVLAAMLWLILEGVLHGQARNLAFPPHALAPSAGFWTGLGMATLYALYDYGGYNTVCAVGGEVLKPASTIPRAIVLAILIIAVLYVAMNIAVIAAVPWREVAASKFIASEMITRFGGRAAGATMTALILISTIAGLFGNMLGLSRVPYAAAVQGRFFSVFARVHPEGRFPSFSVLFTGAGSALCCLLSLDQVIKAFSVAGVILGSLAVVAAPTLLRLGRSDLRRPFRMWLYPLPSLLAAAGWTYIVATSGWPYILGGLTALAGGVLAYLWLARRACHWPWRLAAPERSSSLS